MEFLSRDVFGWGRSTARSASPRSGLVIHYDGSGRNLSAGAHSRCLEYWKDIRRFHVQKNGWTDVGYSFGVCPHDASPSSGGYIFEGRGLRKEQAAQPIGNTTYYSVSLMLGEGEHPTAVQINTVRELREWLQKETGMANVVKGHRDFIATSCPGDILYKLVKNGTFTKPSIKEEEVSAKEVWDYPIVTDKDTEPQQTMRAGTVIGHMEKTQDEMLLILKEIRDILKA